MPRGNGTGPFGNARDSEQRGRRGFGQRDIAGPGGYCKCPHCGEKIPHVAAQPCSQTTCPKCGTRMVREDG